MEKAKIIAIIFIIQKIICITLIILCLVWVFPIYKNSGKDEPTEMKWINSISSDIDEKCQQFLEKFTDEGLTIHEVFSYKMKNIHKYSLALFCLLIIQPSVIIILALFFAIINSMYKGRCFEILKIIIEMWKYLSYLLITLFYSLFYYNCMKSKKNDFEDFSECTFVDSDEFESTYDYIYRINKDIKKLHITFILYLVIFLIPTIIEDICTKKREED